MFSLLWAWYLRTCPPASPRVTSSQTRPLPLSSACRPFAGVPEAAPAQRLQHIAKHITVQVSPCFPIIPCLVSQPPSSSIAAMTYDDVPISSRPEDTVWHVFVRDPSFRTNAVPTGMPRGKYIQACVYVAITQLPNSLTTPLPKDLTIYIHCY